MSPTFVADTIKALRGSKHSPTPPTHFQGVKTPTLLRDVRSCLRRGQSVTLAIQNAPQRKHKLVLFGCRLSERQSTSCGSRESYKQCCSVSSIRTVRLNLLHLAAPGAERRRRITSVKTVLEWREEQGNLEAGSVSSTQRHCRPTAGPAVVALGFSGILKLGYLNRY